MALAAVAQDRDRGTLHNPLGVGRQVGGCHCQGMTGGYSFRAGAGDAPGVAVRLCWCGLQARLQVGRETSGNFRKLPESSGKFRKRPETHGNLRKLQEFSETYAPMTDFIVDRLGAGLSGWGGLGRDVW